MDNIEMDVHGYIAHKIARLRCLRKRTQRHLASEIGVSAAQLAKYETGESRIPAIKLFLIARALRMPVPTFFPQNIMLTPCHYTIGGYDDYSV